MLMYSLFPFGSPDGCPVCQNFFVLERRRC
jgi:hypothetical protein